MPLGRDSWSWGRAGKLRPSSTHDLHHDGPLAGVIVEVDQHELLFWAGLGVAQGGDVDEGARYVRGAIELHDGWRELLARLDPEIAPGAEPVREALGITQPEP